MSHRNALVEGFREITDANHSSGQLRYEQDFCPRVPVTGQDTIPTNLEHTFEPQSQSKLGRGQQAQSPQPPNAEGFGILTLVPNSGTSQSSMACQYSAQVLTRTQSPESTASRPRSITLYSRSFQHYDMGRASSPQYSCEMSWEFLNDFCQAYWDDVLIYSKIQKEYQPTQGGT